MEVDAKQGIAYLIGRGVAAEKALQTTISSSARGAALAESLRVNLQMTRDQLSSSLALAQIGQEFLPFAEEGFDGVRAAALRGAANGKYVIPKR
ncbi:hypothetical protein [Stenotrophomonas maltophilia]|uniref:hypothetical protein n=1 Tax=Stenotrophomonas maltophilia TaxID=40324 RepID=UPI0015DDD036|nr:hypothetical protein [Stenotrophomonas maltophilia]MBA0416173.1 hypothetical protein [Stenotrophomonas maltophilia]MBH1749312.1 hypothetical protein [Stenotrophomonas maltophilia]